MLKAIAFRIVVKPDAVKKEEKTLSGIVIASVDTDHDKKGATIRGTIVDIGPDAWKAYRPSQEFAGLKVGDVVYYAKYSGKLIKETDEGEEFLVLNDEDVVCKVETN